jgi:hypothetical protein
MESSDQIEARTADTAKVAVWSKAKPWIVLQRVPPQLGRFIKRRQRRQFVS